MTKKLVEQMKNKEKNASKIVDIACKGNKFGVDEKTDEVVDCLCTPCQTCLLFRMNDCDKARIQWAESEYIEKQVISKKDKAFLDYLNENTHYISRDLNGALYVYISKPHKLIDCWESVGCEVDKTLRMFNIDFPMVKWEDAEPWLIEDLKKFEVVEEYD